MKVCFTSYRPFADGPVEKPFHENDPVNIAYALNGSYVSFYSLKRLSDLQLKERLRDFDLVICALDVEAIDLSRRIVEVCEGRAATYSEGHIGDYQRLSPAGQVSFLKALNAASINFLYWEKYIPFYRALTDSPVEYLPYPYLGDEARSQLVPLTHRPALVALPSGLAGFTRNGLASLAVAKQLLGAKLIDEVACWLSPESFEEDAQAIHYFLLSIPFVHLRSSLQFRLRHWLLSSHIDYRPLLRMVKQLRRTAPSSPATTVRVRNVSLFRRSSWAKYVSQVASARILIDMNNRETVGRNALDCAALGIPCISTTRSDLQFKIFPETTVQDAWDIDAAVQICKRLLSDSLFYERVTARAATALQEYDVDAFRKRFDILANRYLTKAHEARA